MDFIEGGLFIVKKTRDKTRAIGWLVSMDYCVGPYISHAFSFPRGYRVFIFYWLQKNRISGIADSDLLTIGSRARSRLAENGDSDSIGNLE